MTLTDAGPLIALIDKGQGVAHQQCVEAQKSLRGPLLTTWPCFTEAMYFLGHLAGWSGQEALWNLLSQQTLFVHTPNVGATERIRTLMEKYKDAPMDLADASLVTLAEETGLKMIFTLDTDFYIYRINGKENFDVIP
jgi:predicted nucleic acid-binding protein